MKRLLAATLGVLLAATAADALAQRSSSDRGRDHSRSEYRHDRGQQRIESRRDDGRGVRNHEDANKHRSDRGRHDGNRRNHGYGGRDGDHRRYDRGRPHQGYRGYDHRGPNHHWRSPDWRRSWHHGWSGKRYSAPSRYYYPRGYSAHYWRIGYSLPRAYVVPNYYIDYRPYGLAVPPHGCRWIRIDSDVLLIDTLSGEIVDILYGFFY